MGEDVQAITLKSKVQIWQKLATVIQIITMISEMHERRSECFNIRFLFGSILAIIISFYFN